MIFWHDNHRCPSSRSPCGDGSRSSKLNYINSIFNICLYLPSTLIELRTYLALTRKPPLLEILSRIYHLSTTFARLYHKQICKFSREFCDYKASDIPEASSSDGV